MKRLTRFVTLGAGLAVVATACGATSADVTREQLEVTSVGEKATVFELLDLGPAGFGPGDQIIEVAPVTDDAEATIGRTDTTVTILSGDALETSTAVIDCTVTLPGGVILFHGSFAFEDLGSGVVLPVVGGTEAYAGAGGTVTATAPTETETELAFDLLIPNAD